ncbi:MAG: membrane protein insertase YidC, partial [Gammaproteobacteria bacterium]|nr:membrane protein insertase YidC [Gammaproteobacteria bacterium]
MEFQRILLFAALTLTLMMMWQAWQEDYVRPQQQVATDSAETAAAKEQGLDLPTAPMSSATSSNTTSLPIVATMKSVARVSVETDLLTVEIDTLGADIRNVRLKNYPVTLEEPDNAFALIRDRGEISIPQSGLLSSAESGVTLPTHHDLFYAEKEEYRLAPGEDSLQVALHWDDTSGIEVTKTYTFHRDRYTIDVDYLITNHSDKPWSGHAYHQLLRQRPQSGGNAFLYTYTGGVVYSEAEKYEKISFEDMESRPLQREVTNGWVAMIEHYFLSAWIPSDKGKMQVYSKSPGGENFIIGMIDAGQEIAPNSSGRITSQLFIGPKLQNRLSSVATGLELTVDYGILTVIAKPLDWLLQVIHSVVGNWGFAIIFLTILIKAAFYKLSETSYKSMAQMRKMQPKLKAMKERYGDDRTAMNQAMMKLYKEEKINPLGGCL